MISPGKAFPCTSISVRPYLILNRQEFTVLNHLRTTYFQSMWKCELFILSQKAYLQSSVTDPDPYAFGPPGSGSGSKPKCHGSATLLQRSNCLGASCFFCMWLIYRTNKLYIVKITSHQISYQTITYKTGWHAKELTSHWRPRSSPCQQPSPPRRRRGWTGKKN